MMIHALEEIFGDFYAHGIPNDIKPRQVDYLEKRQSVTVVTGMRRTGKTYVTYQRMRELLASGIPLERIVHVNFEDERLRNLKVDDLHLISDLHAKMFPNAANEKCWYFLDELQIVEGWELYARRLLDSQLVQLCLTGSSSRLLSHEIATEMRGRSFETEVFPLSFPETLVFNGLIKEIPRPPFSSRTAGALRNAMENYLEKGGFPDIQGDSDRIRVKTLQEYVDAVVFRDVIERFEIPSIQALSYTLHYLINNYARKLSTRAIAGVLKQNGLSGNRENIADYIDHFKNAYLVYPVQLRTDSLSVRNTNPNKYYLVDTGLIRAMTPKNDAEKGWLLENLVFITLRRGFNKIEYFNTKCGSEIDFYVTDRLTKRCRLLQVSWEISDEKTFQREISAMRTARQETGITDCVIVTWDNEMETDDGIRIVPVWKWTLEEETMR